MLAFVDEGRIVQYPVGVGELRRRFPNVSFPPDLSRVDLAPYGAAVVHPAVQPSVDVTSQRLVEGEPEFSDGAWRQTWKVAPLSAAEIAAQVEQRAAAARQKRNQLLAESDFSQLTDAPVDREAWATYRQLLRDVTTQAGFPDVIDWPQKPD